MDDNKLPAKSSSNAFAGGTEISGKTASLNLDHSTAALFSYCPLFALNIFFCLLFLATEPKESKFVRFHALQSLMIFGSAVTLCFIILFLSVPLHFIPFVGSFMIAGLYFFLSIYLTVTVVVSLFMMYKAHQGSLYRLPVIGHYADLYSSGSNLGSDSEIS